MKNLKLRIPASLAFSLCLLLSCKDNEEPIPEPTISIPPNVLNLVSFTGNTI